MEDLNSVYTQALEAGRTSLREPKNQFYGVRSACIEDDWKNQWWIATHKRLIDLRWSSVISPSDVNGHQPAGADSTYIS